jgi:hypothetical protein
MGFVLPLLAVAVPKWRLWQGQALAAIRTSMTGMWVDDVASVIVQAMAATRASRAGICADEGWSVFRSVFAISVLRPSGSRGVG